MVARSGARGSPDTLGSVPIAIRTPPPDDVRGFLETGAKTFQEALREEDAERDERVLDRERMFAAYDGDALVGTAADIALTLTVPGGEATAAGVTLVGVLPTHRRRGILNRLMRAELDAIAERGEPLAILWASEEPIYGRYGYGVATVRVAIEAERARMRFRGDPPPAGSVRLVDENEAARVLPPIYERARRETPGMFARSEAWWREYRLPDPEHHRDGAGPRYFAVLELDGEDAGYARYRVKDDWQDGITRSSLRVIEAIGTSPLADRELWRYLFGVDLVDKIASWHVPIDHPLFVLVTEPRRLHARLSDGLWVRIVDLESALATRSYADDGAVAFQLIDSFLPPNEGVWRLEASGGEGAVSRFDGEPELRLDVADLGSAFLGGFTFTQLARGGRVEELAAGAVSRADDLFRTRIAPWCPEIF
jgi:predicted acetyltransferase